MLHIYNNLTRQKELFQPIKPGKIGIYLCGPTTYDYCHIGNARVFVVFDIIVRYLRARNFDVTFVRNITDIDDKIIKRAQENNEPAEVLAQRFIEAMHEDFDKLNLLTPDSEPRATLHIPEIINIIQVLIDNGHAYIAGNGDVCYNVHQFKDYGKLAHKDIEGLRAGARVSVVDAKQDPLDFVLWKLAKPGEPQWDSPWGAGRPGWHIECSAMSTACLGNHFDIHGGGVDLQFPHHENEIAQSEAATGEPFVNTWMHVGFVQVNKEKMSKSLGNFFTIREVLEKYKPEVVRYFLLASHYRSAVNYSQESLDNAAAALKRFYTALRDLPPSDVPHNTDYEKQFHEAMDDDFNTPEALAILFEMTHEIHRVREHDLAKAGKLGALLRKFAGVLGVLQQESDNYLQGELANSDLQEIENLIAQRNQARDNKEWAEADRVRDLLANKGIILEDNPNGTIWRKDES